MVACSRRSCCGPGTTSWGSTPATTSTAGSTAAPTAPRTRSTRTCVDLTVDDIAGVDAVVHMAELSNDPLGALAPDVTYEINHDGSVRLANLAKAGRRRAASSTCPPAASTAWPTGADVDRDLAPVNPQTAVRRMQGAGRAGRRGAGRRHLLADVPAQRHRLRRLAADAVRHRAEQPRRARLDHRRDRHDQRRHAVAPAGARARHRQGDRAASLEAPRERRPQRDLQRRRQRPELPGPRDRGDDRARSSPAASSASATTAATTAATGSTSRRSTRSCPASPATGTPNAAPGSCTRSSAASTSTARPSPAAATPA